MTLRAYQQTAVDNIFQHWEEGRRRVLTVMPTGGGKTEVAIDAIRTLATPRSRALVIVERKQLAYQWLDRLRSYGFNHVGILQGENSIRLSAPIVVAMAQSIRTRGMPTDVALVVIDESHIWHGTHDAVLAQVASARVLGLTATPLRDGLGLRFDAMVVGSTIRSLIDQEYLVRPRYFAPANDTIERALDDVAVRAGDYAADQLSVAMRSKAVVGDCVGEWKRHGQDRQTIAFCVDKTHAAQMAAEFSTAGVEVEVVVDDTADEDRKRIFAAFNARKVRILVSVGVLSIGFDSPVCSCAILARPTLSTSLHIQQGGRVLRPHPGKGDALILDHAMNTLRHGRLEDFEPPESLSVVDKKTDRRGRHEPALAWVCRDCQAINGRSDDICLECGTPRQRGGGMVTLDGTLVSLDGARTRSPSRPNSGEIRKFYRMAIWHGRTRNLGNAGGWAFYATARRFKLNPAEAKRMIKWIWRDADPLPPDDDASRWLQADFLRGRIAMRNRPPGAAHPP